MSFFGCIISPKNLFAIFSSSSIPVKNLEQDNICNEETFDALFRQHSNDLYKFLYYKYGMENNPRDLVQEAFIKLWDNCHKILPGKARSFLFTVANNQVLNDIARKKTALKYRDQAASLGHEAFEEHDDSQSGYMEKLRSALEELSDEHRVTLLLNRIEGKKHQEIADMLGISRKAVEKRIYTALARLREIMINNQ